MNAGPTIVTPQQRYLGIPLDPFVTPLAVNKLNYFMQEAGDPLRLQYVTPVFPY